VGFGRMKPEILGERGEKGEKVLGCLDGVRCDWTESKK